MCFSVSVFPLPRLIRAGPLSLVGNEEECRADPQTARHQPLIQKTPETWVSLALQHNPQKLTGVSGKQAQGRAMRLSTCRLTLEGKPSPEAALPLQKRWGGVGEGD